MDFEIIERQELLLLGMDFFGDPYAETEDLDMNAVGRLWQLFTDNFEKRAAQLRNLVSRSHFEVWIDFEDERDKITNKNEYIFIGVEINNTNDVPLEFVVKKLPATRYLKFLLQGTQITSNWPEKIEDLLYSQGFSRSYDYLVERYDEHRFKSISDPSSEVEIWVPIK